MTRSQSVLLPSPRFVDAVEPTDFQRLKHAAYLKGLLRPFKSKGELETWASQCEELRQSLTGLAQRMLSQATAYPLNALPVVLAQQSTSAGTTFLRWRNVDRSAMGVALWVQVMSNPATPLALAHEIYALELQRIVLNMQVSLMHTLSRQAVLCAQKMGEAETIYNQRLQRHRTHTYKEPVREH